MFNRQWIKKGYIELNEDGIIQKEAAFKGVGKDKVKSESWIRIV